MIEYESPITQIVGEMQTEYENHVLKAVQNVGIYVNREELVKALAYDRGQYEKRYEDGLNADKWIPCSERLPDKNINVLVCDGYDYIDICSLTNGLSWMDENGDLWSHSSYIAWQPLPAPYQKGE